MFWKWKKLDSWVKKMDKIVTGLILWWAVASIFWLTHTKKWKEVTKEVSKKITPFIWSTSKKAISWFWKTIAFFVSVINKK